MRYMIEYGLSSPISKKCKDVFIRDGEREIIFNFDNTGGYTDSPNVKFVVPAQDYNDAIKNADQFALPYIEKIMMVYRIKLVISPQHFILEGRKGKVERSCRVWKLWKRGAHFHEEHVTQQKINEIIHTDFENYNEKAVGHFRLACLSSSAIDRFRNLRLALESLIPARESPKVRKCEKCSSDLYCGKCNGASTVSGILDDDISDFWRNNMISGGGDDHGIDEILKFRHITFHASPISRIYEHDLESINRTLEIGLGFYFTAGTQFVPMEPDYGRRYCSELSFQTKFRGEEFPQDFPKEDYWRKKIISPPADE